jgi:probable phosphoglycerate mutase
LVCSALGIRPDDVEFDDRLKEHAYGDWEGRTKLEIQHNEPELHARREANRWDVAAPKGENYSMVAERMRAWLADVEGQTIVAISHGCAGRILRVVYANLPKSQVSGLSEAHDEIHVLADGRIDTVQPIVRRP